MGHGHSLAAFYLFNDVPVPDRALLEALLVRTTHGQGDVIFHEGDEAEAMYAVEDGAVEIVKDSGRTVVATLAKGDAFGELAFFDGRPRSAAARARQRTVVLSLPYAGLREFLAAHPALALAFFRNAATAVVGRLRQTTSDLSWLNAYVWGG